MLLNEIKHKPPVDTDTEYGIDAGRYVGVHFDEKTKRLLSDIVKGENIKDPTPADKMHSTIVYSKDNKVDGYDVQGKMDEPIEAEINDFDLFNTSDGKCLVAKLQSDELRNRHNRARELGASYDYDEYIPHVTLSYNANDLGDEDLERLRKKYVGSKLYADEEYEEPIERDWSKKNT